MMRFILLAFLPFLLFAQDHLLITEVLVPPESNSSIAFVEIHNPGSQPIDLNQYYLANYNTFYELVNNDYSQNNAHFLCKFPGFSLEANQTITVAINGTAFLAQFGKNPDFEISSTNDDIPDLDALYLGNNPKLEFTRGMVIMFQWNGQADLVADADYFPWGLAPFHTAWMDKTGISIDGPDGDTNSSVYNDDVATNQQMVNPAPTGGLSLQREGITEVDEIGSNGNGITGHNEAGENFKTSFTSAEPTPGIFSQTPGDGSGTISVNPDTVQTGSTSDFEFNFTGVSDYSIYSLYIIVPSAWGWSQNSSDVQVSGNGAGSSSVGISGDTIFVNQTAITDQNSAVVTLQNLTAPAESRNYSFETATAIEDGNLTPIGSFPLVYVQKKITINEIIENFNDYDGQRVTLEAVVAIGAGITRDDRTDAFIQDASFRGLNISDANPIFPDLQRGNKIRISGDISQYQGDPQIQNFSTQVLSTGNVVPGVRQLGLFEAGNMDLKGTMIETAGYISDMFTFADGNTNITISDGSTSLVVRVWKTTGIDVDVFSIGDTIGVRAVIDEFSNAPQLLVGYQEDLFPGKIKVAAAGSGIVSTVPDSVGKTETTSIDFVFNPTSEDTVTAVSIEIPTYWQWSGQAGDVITSDGFRNAAISIQNEVISLSVTNLHQTNIGTVTIQNLATPDADTASVFVIKTGRTVGSLAEINIQPIILVGEGTAIPTISIAEARLLPEGSRVAVKGTIVIGSGVLRTNSTSAYIFDQSKRGINIYQSRLDPQIERGNYVVVQGILTEYENSAGDITLEITDYNTIVLKTNATIPEPVKLSPFAASNLDPGQEGMWVEVEGQINTITSDDFGDNVYVGDNAGEVISRINRDTGIDISSFAKNDFLTVRGIISVYRGDIQVQPGYQDDIFVYDPNTKPVDNSIELNLPPKPFVPEKGEVLPIDYTINNTNSHVTIRIFDLGGRMIITLFDGAPYDLELNWNGRDKINELVPIGTYICHLEVVDNDTGNRQVKFAPIIVGTVLSR